MKKTVAILGATGMLGSALYAELKDKYGLVLTVRSKDKIKLLEEHFGGTEKCKIVEFDVALFYKDFEVKKGYQSPYFKNFLSGLGEVDYVINAIGVTIPFSLENPALTFFINGALPHVLANMFREKLIHVTTDCAYNGIEGFPYDENSPKSPVDIYGLSKSLGEPLNCLTLRMSIIGRELEGHTGLLDWFLAQKGKTVKGFANHFWNGLTAKQFAKTCAAIIANPEAFPKTGLYHIFSTPVSKYEMLQALQKKFNIDCKIVPDYSGKLNRTLATVHELNSALHIPSFEEMVQTM